MCRNIKTLFNFEPPATEDEMNAKIDDCRGIYRRRTNHGPTMPEFRAELRDAIGAAGG